MLSSSHSLWSWQLIYSCFAQVLVKEKGYDPTLLEDDFDDLKDFWYGLLLISHVGKH